MAGSLPACLVEGIRHCRAKYKPRAHQHGVRISRHVQVVCKGQANARVGQQQRTQLPARGPLAHEEHADHDGERGVGEQDQPLQAGGDVLQADEVENARAVVAQQAQCHDGQPVAPRQRGQVAAGAPAHPGEHGHRKCHAQAQQGDGVQRHGLGYGIGQLHKNGFEGETQRCKDGKGKAKALGGPVFPGHGVVLRISCE